jgi:LysM repeat protein
MSLKLPQPGAAWSQQYQQRVNQTHEANDLKIRKLATDVEIAPGQKLVIRSPNGARWQITVSNSGTVGATAL